MKVCPSCKEVAELNRWGICEACQHNEDEDDERQSDIAETRRSGEIE